jgi:hypothetical protein
VVRDAALAGPRVLRPLAVLVASGFDGFVEEACRAYYARTMVTIADCGDGATG